MRLANVIVLVVGFALLACGEEPPSPLLPDDAQSIGGAPAVEQACADYCGAALSAGCPQPEACELSCASMFTGACDEALAAFLESVQSQFWVGCIVAFRPGESGEIHSQADWELDRCAGMRSSSAEGPQGCEGESAGGALMSCDQDGHCSCWAGENFLGTCHAIIAGIDACELGSSCCSAFL